MSIGNNETKNMDCEQVDNTLIDAPKQNISTDANITSTHNLECLTQSCVEPTICAQSINSICDSKKLTDDSCMNLSYNDVDMTSNSKLCDKVSEDVQSHIKEILERVQMKNKRMQLPLEEFRPIQKIIFDPEVYQAPNLFQLAPNFKEPKYVDGILDSTEVESQLNEFAIKQGIPLVITNIHRLPEFDANVFSMDWLLANYKDLVIPVRNLPKSKDEKMTIEEYVDSVQGKDHTAVKYYAKDVDPPREWEEAANKFIPPFLQYKGSDDLNGLMPEELQIQNLQIYIGYEGSYTSTHFDICGSVGHNIMVHADEGCSALWFMIPPEFANEARKYYYQHGGGNTSVDQDNCALSVEMMMNAPFPIYCFEQKVGDFVIVPTGCIHQVVNLGQGFNTKYSWNRNTATSLDYALNVANKVNRQIFKPETYRTRTMVQEGLHHLVGKLHFGSNEFIRSLSDFETERFREDYFKLLSLYARMLFEEHIDTNFVSAYQSQPIIVSKESEQIHSRICDVCKCDIWNNWFSCGTCRTGIGGPWKGHDFCVDCFAVGRKCQNMQGIEWRAYLPVQECLDLLFNATQLFLKYGNELGFEGELDSKMLNFQDLERLHDNKISPLTTAVQRLDNYKSLQSKACHECKRRVFQVDTTNCSQCKTCYCFACHAQLYNQNPYDLVPLKDWKCYRCAGTCNCKTCIEEGTSTNPIMPSLEVFRFKDYFGNYFLNENLIYSPVFNYKWLHANAIDGATIFGKWIGTDKLGSIKKAEFSAIAPPPRPEAVVLLPSKPITKRKAKFKLDLKAEEPNGEQKLLPDQETESIVKLEQDDKMEIECDSEPAKEQVADPQANENDVLSKPAKKITPFQFPNRSRFWDTFFLDEPSASEIEQEQRRKPTSPILKKRCKPRYHPSKYESRAQEYRIKLKQRKYLEKKAAEKRLKKSQKAVTVVPNNSDQPATVTAIEPTSIKPSAPSSNENVSGLLEVAENACEVIPSTESNMPTTLDPVASAVKLEDSFGLAKSGPTYLPTSYGTSTSTAPLRAILPKPVSSPGIEPRFGMPHNLTNGSFNSYENKDWNRYTTNPPVPDFGTPQAVGVQPSNTSADSNGDLRPFNNGGGPLVPVVNASVARRHETFANHFPRAFPPAPTSQATSLLGRGGAPGSGVGPTFLVQTPPLPPTSPNAHLKRDHNLEGLYQFQSKFMKR